MKHVLLDKLKEESHKAELRAKAFSMLEEVAFEMCGDVIPRKCFEYGSRAMKRFNEWYSSLPAEDAMELKFHSSIEQWVNFTQTQLDILEKDSI